MSLQSNLARWEPCHKGFRFRHPWKQYLKIGTLTRECAYRVESISTFLDFENQVSVQSLGNLAILTCKFSQPWRCLMTLITDSFIQSTSIHSMVQEPITRSCLGSGRLLKELGSTIRDMTKPSLADQHIANLKSTSHDLKSIVRSACRWEDLDLFKISPVTAISLVLIDTVTCVEKLS